MIPKLKNGKRVACIGAGPASLTVANDLLPLGYEVVIFEQWDVPGRPDAHQHPGVPPARNRACRGDRLHRRDGREIRYEPIDSLTKLLDKGGFDAVFVGSGAPKGKDSDCRARRKATPTSTSASRGSSRSRSGTSTRSAKRVLIIGVGNTAMDCCRSSLRLGAKDVKVMARKPRAFFKASDWELEDAEDENVEIVINHAPKAFVVEGGKLDRHAFDTMEYDIDARAASPPSASPARSSSRATT